jgi:hypothetical protein
LILPSEYGLVREGQMYVAPYPPAADAARKEADAAPNNRPAAHLARSGQQED